MRVAGVTLSVVLHAALVLSGIVIAPKLMAEPPQMTILPVELLTIADTTNVAPVVEDKPKDAEQAEETADKAAPAPTPEAKPEPAPEPEEALPDAKKPEPPKPPKEEPKPKPAPEAKKPEKMADTLDSILKSVPDKKPSKTQADRATANLNDVKDATARRGAGDNQSMTITIAAYISSQLRRRGCWPDQKDMPDAKRLHATIRVKFERGGKLAEDPKMLDPPRQPVGDKPMQVFTQRAFSALRQCEPFQVPPEYFNNPGYIDLVFLP
jgi:outer membrane biosynthesis protein TonB